MTGYAPLPDDITEQEYIGLANMGLLVAVLGVVELPVTNSRSCPSCLRGDSRLNKVCAPCAGDGTGVGFNNNRKHWVFSAKAVARYIRFRKQEVIHEPTTT